MKVGDLVRSTILDHWSTDRGILGIVVEAYDTPKGLWKICWSDGGAFHHGSLAHENNLEVINENR